MKYTNSLFVYHINGVFFFLQMLSILSKELIYFIFFKVNTIERIASQLASINILYVKIFQAIALNNQILDEKMSEVLMKYTDNAPWDLDDIDYETLLGICDAGFSFPDGFESPINSGMISLVFKANKTNLNKKSLQPVIIKLKRKNIEEKLQNAIDKLLYVVSILSAIPFFKQYHIYELIEKNVEIIIKQTDFQEEIKSMIKMKENCQNIKYVKIPSVYELTNYPNVIVMEYIKGTPFHLLKSSDYESFAKLVVKFGCVTTFIHGFAHGDLHAGNILFIKDETNEKYKYKLGILDFGIMYEIEEDFKDFLHEIVTDINEFDLLRLANKIMQSGKFIQPLETIKSLPLVNYNNIVKIIKVILTETLHSSDSQVKIYHFVNRFHHYMECLPNYKLYLSDNFVKTQLAIAMTYGLTNKLCNSDCMSVFNVVSNEMFHTDLLKD